METDSSQMDIGIEEEDRLQIAAGLSRLLADSYTLYLKTHNYHWNVTGPMFQTLSANSVGGGWRWPGFLTR